MRKELILLVKIMGCICSKGVSSNDYVHNDIHVRDKETRSSKKLAAAPLRRDDVAMVGETDGVSNDATTRLISHGLVEENTGSTAAVAWENGPKTELFNDKLTMPKLERRSSVSSGGNQGHPQAKVSRIVSTPNGVEAAHTAAGWPSWLTSVAAEAISGWVPRRAESFEKLEKIGQGTYSSVYKARDLESGKIVAMKKVRFMNMDPESVRFMAREIHILRKLDHPNVMKLECLVTSRVSGSLYLVFEYMEHDLAGLAARPGVKFTEPQIKCFLQQIFCGLEHCHSRGVLHRDIKGSNLLIDSNGNLKIGDFGLATFFRSNQRNPLTSRVVTLWYRPPELLLGSTDYGVSVDLWSAGCILAELFHGKPIMPGRTEVEQLHKIFKLCGSPSEEYWKKSRLPHATIFKPQHPYRRCLPDTFKDFPSSALALLDVLLAVEPEHRGSASTALQSEFFTAYPLPCDPSSLPKYPPSKEFDARRRDEEARRNRAGSGKSNILEVVRKDGRPSRAVPAPNANAELQVSIQKRFGLTHAKANSEKFNQEEDGGSGFPIEPPRALTQNGLSHSGPLAPSGPFVPSRALNDKEDEALLGPNQASVSLTNGELRTFGRHGSRGSSRLSRFAGSGGPQAGTNREDGICNQLGGGALLEKSDWSNHLPERPQSSNKKDNGVPGKGYAAADRIHCSGPLLHAGVNMDDLLKDNEKQIQQAFRKARSDMTKLRRHNGDNRQTESLLHH